MFENEPLPLSRIRDTSVKYSKRVISRDTKLKDSKIHYKKASSAICSS